jgi:hypothetical protein
MLQMEPQNHALGLLSWSFVVVVAAHWGCGGNDNPSRTSANTGGAASSSIATGGSPGSTSIVTGGAQGTSGGTASQGGTSSGGADASSPGRNQGQILITNMSEAYPMFRTNVTCPYQPLGECKFSPLSTCDTSTESYVSAGTITVTSDASSYDRAVDVSITPNTNNTYPSTNLNNSYVGNEVVHLAASGATVPAFSADITVPLALLVSSPPPDATGYITASTTSDLIITFSRGAPRKNVVVLASNSFGTLYCDVPSESGQLTIPAGALAAYGAGNQFPLYTSGITEIQVGQDWSIAVGALLGAYTEDKTHAVTVVLE